MRFTVLIGLLIFLGGCGESSPASPALTGEGGVGGPVEEGGASPDAGNRSDSPALDPCEELECDDLNSCTVDSCVDGACIHQGDKRKTLRRRKCLHDGRCVLHGGTLCGSYHRGVQR